ncbi:MAG: glycosyl hydrolase 115 family protein [Lachnospiraceae bacterium]|nr:glycosyl hydrolase 115 family protein [Lachnospiraceae bacterium]
MIIRNNTKITGITSEPVQKATANLLRDIGKVITPVPERTEEDGEIRLIYGDEAEECFTLDATEGALRLSASDELGFIYGLYEISGRFLGIRPFWFWNDQVIEQKAFVEIPAGFHYASQPYAIRFRGWFINDEVLLADWQVDQNPDRPWEMAMEALLRLGGNLVIPGTDRNSEKYRPLASSMGLYVTHHHAEPLGAPIFAREYPDLQPSYAKYPEKFQELWRRGIEEQKDCKTVWNLGFRGQGDAPFWADDPAYQTDEARGKLISELIQLQYEMVQEAQPGAYGDTQSLRSADVPPKERIFCCTNLYGETMELYQKGCLKLPEQIIKVWADNGYGKMVSRRQGNHNPRVPALPEAHHSQNYNPQKNNLQISDRVGIPKYEINGESIFKNEEAQTADALPGKISGGNHGTHDENPHGEYRGIRDEVPHGDHHGIYYHVSFYDLQAANHITMLPNSPEFVVRELDEVLRHGVNDFWLINCSNVKPHVYMLDLVASLWKRPLPSVGGRSHCPFQDASRGAVLWKRPLPSVGGRSVRPLKFASRRSDLWKRPLPVVGGYPAPVAFAEDHRRQYLRNYYGSEHLDELASCLQQYFDAAVSYGPHEDDHAGEQFYNHGIRILASQYLKDSGNAAAEFQWAKKADTLTEQIHWYRQRCEAGSKSYGELLDTCEKLAAKLSGSAKTLFEDSIYLQAKIYAYCAKGGCLVCRGLEEAYEGKYQKAFYLVGKGRKEYLRARRAMRDREHDVWKNFYRNECLTDIAQTAWVLETVMGYIRNLGDGPHFYEWQRDFLYTKEDRNVRMILNLENHLNNQEMFELMEKKIENDCSRLP